MQAPSSGILIVPHGIEVPDSTTSGHAACWHHFTHTQLVYGLLQPNFGCSRHPQLVYGPFQLSFECSKSLSYRMVCFRPVLGCSGRDCSA